MNYKQIPFDINIAKDIVSGKVDGKITTRKKHNVHIYEFNLKGKYSIAGKIISGIGNENISSWNKKGYCINDNVLDYGDLILWIKEEYKFKPYDRILVPYCDSNLETNIYVCRFFSHYVRDGRIVVTTNGGSFSADKVLPFEGNEHLVGTGTIDK